MLKEKLSGGTMSDNSRSVSRGRQPANLKTEGDRPRSQEPYRLASPISNKGRTLIPKEIMQ